MNVNSACTAYGYTPVLHHTTCDCVHDCASVWVCSECECTWCMCVWFVCACVWCVCVCLTHRLRSLQSLPDPRRPPYRQGGCLDLRHDDIIKVGLRLRGAPGSVVLVVCVCACGVCVCVCVCLWVCVHVCHIW